MYSDEEENGGQGLIHSVTGLNLDNPLSASNVIKEWEGRLDEEEYVESGVDDDVRPLLPPPAPREEGVQS
jgi:hypothetical protein